MELTIAFRAFGSLHQQTFRRTACYAVSCSESNVGNALGLKGANSMMAAKNESLAGIFDSFRSSFGALRV